MCAAHKQSAFKPAQLTQGKTHRLNPLPRLLFPIASPGQRRRACGSTGGCIPFCAGGGAATSAHLQIGSVWEQERAVAFCAGGGAATSAHHQQIRFLWEQQRAEGKLFSFCACTSDLGALEGDPAHDCVARSPSAQVEEQQPAHITCKFVSFGSSKEQKASYFHSAHVLLIWAPWKVILHMTVCYFHLSPRESGQQTINKARGCKADYLIKY
jgi:hypothetical protein